MWQLILALAIASSAGWGASRAVSRKTVYEYQHALLFSKGRFVRLLEPGAYWLFLPNSQIQTLDARPKVLTIPGQEVLMKDGVPLKVSLLIGYKVANPQIVTLDYEDYEQHLYALVQTELRRFLSDLTLEEILRERNRISVAIEQSLIDVTASMGIEVRSTSVKDVMLAGSLKDSFSKVAKARQEGLAALEKARGESAALRHLANAAKMIEKNPRLYQLRLLSSLDGAASVVVHLDTKDGEVVCEPQGDRSSPEL